MENNLPKKFESLSDGLYDLEIDVQTKPGFMKIVEGIHKGKEKEYFRLSYPITGLSRAIK